MSSSLCISSLFFSDKVRVHLENLKTVPYFPEKFKFLNNDFTPE